MSNVTLTELDEIIKQAGRTPYTWEMRGHDVWIRHIISGGVDDPVYEYSRVGTIEETERMIKREFSQKREPPIPGYCPRCQHYSSNLTIHNCRHTFMIMADEAYRNGDHAKVNEIVANAKAQGIDLTSPEPQGAQA